MGWSEQYWEDVKSELVQPAIEPEPPSDDQSSDQPAATTPSDVPDEH